MTTIQDVAMRAGCAISTVSRVLNGSPHTTEATRVRVMAAVDELGYRVNTIGRSLKTQKTGAFGVLIPSITNPVFASSLGGIEEAARTAGYDIIVTTSNYDPGRDGEAVEALLARGVEGVLLTVTDPATGRVADRLAARHVPHVLLYNQPIDPAVAAVTVDNRRATADLTGEVIARGHTDIGYVSGVFGSSDRARIRYAGYCDRMREAGLKPQAAVEVPFVGQDRDFVAAVARFLNAPTRPTALLCSNDLLAIRIMAAARTLGLRVPEDLSVAGFDGIDIGRMVEPSLATILQPAADMGRQAVQFLFALMRGEREPATLIMPHTFRPGRSLAAARGGTIAGALRAAPAPALNRKTIP
ncbi:LacI family DNA-binding transcriptional regulator [Acuticoccus mangrovi]|uniref:LacI family DNA-binding transcriptional regulator n=1 Tax=Acuticoccus mangrovi TaxID=2796142 RepID=A0A934IM35_9HYPH|nr:LacI family DNA-binding transcriptional regulator [Acuticoccus mangrovi]MBJ3774420.1 LacI family DNA-binding transcriptional regulator [Acuticoccus mangrovi]